MADALWRVAVSTTDGDDVRTMVHTLERYEHALERWMGEWRGGASVALVDPLGHELMTQDHVHLRPCDGDLVRSDLAHAGAGAYIWSDEQGRHVAA